MQKKTAAILMGLLACLSSAHASAQTFGRRGDISFAADRLMGVYIVDRDRANSDFIFGLGGPPGSGFGQYNAPRLGIDGFITNGLSLGGSLVVGHDGNSDSTGFLFTPRVGYAIPIGTHFGFWPRGGLTLWDGNHANDGGFAVTGEALFWATPADWGFLFGPTLDFQLDNPHTHAFGLMTGGVFAWL